MTYKTANLAGLVRSVADSHQHPCEPLLQILHDIQHRMGYVDPAVVPSLATALSLPPIDVANVVMAYRGFRSEPADSWTLEVRRAEACQSVGANALQSRLEKPLGIKSDHATQNGSTSLDQVFCLGNCASDPSALINGRVQGRHDVDRVIEVVESEQTRSRSIYRENRQPSPPPTKS